MWSVSTKPDKIKQLENLRSRFEIKARLLSIIRLFFESEGFLEAITPVRISAPAPEEYIEAVKSDGMFLRTSPELEMKRLLAAGYESIYQIGPCFRAGERGRFHREEFLMLEWYQSGIDYLELLDFTQRLLVFCAKRMPASNVDFTGEWKVYTVDEAFIEFAGISVFDALKNDEFEELLVTKVEPSLPKDKAVVLKDYPAEQASLARLKKDDSKVAERWELYLGGIEIANAFGELVDAKEQKKRFIASSKYRKANGMANYPKPLEFFEALDSGIPESSGCAMGLDRLALVFAKEDSLDNIVFP
jgi:lysyl-tRNA synthetase class 2